MTTDTIQTRLTLSIFSAFLRLHIRLGPCRSRWFSFCNMSSWNLPPRQTSVDMVFFYMIPRKSTQEKKLNLVRDMLQKLDHLRWHGPSLLWLYCHSNSSTTTTKTGYRSEGPPARFLVCILYTVYTVYIWVNPALRNPALPGLFLRMGI